MALRTCRDCQKQVSDTAPTCPNCGRKMQLGYYTRDLGANGFVEISSAPNLTQEILAKAVEKKFAGKYPVKIVSAFTFGGGVNVNGSVLSRGVNLLIYRTKDKTEIMVKKLPYMLLFPMFAFLILSHQCFDDVVSWLKTDPDFEKIASGETAP